MPLDPRCLPGCEPRGAGPRPAAASQAAQPWRIAGHWTHCTSVSLIRRRLPHLYVTGQPLFVHASRPDAGGFDVLLTYLQVAAFGLLLIWSIVLQVMGFSEIQGLALRKAFGVWLLGQLIGVLVSLFLALLIEMLFPTVLGVIPQH